MANSMHLVAGFGLLTALAAGYGLVSRRRRVRKPAGLAEANLTEDERREAMERFKALSANATEAPVFESLG